MLRHALSGAIALACFAAPALADEAPPSRCIAASVPHGAIAAADGHWTPLSAEQRNFLVGVYAANPETPAGLPYGDKAVLATVRGNPGGLVFFIDGDRACTPMPIPKELIEMLGDVAAGVVRHEGAL